MKSVLAGLTEGHSLCSVFTKASTPPALHRVWISSFRAAEAWRRRKEETKGKKEEDEGKVKWTEKNRRKGKRQTEMRVA